MLKIKKSIRRLLYFFEKKDPNKIGSPKPIELLYDL